ncbi:MAG: YebC/PmpR family DNA-binding transcriptional regulator [Marinomonas sp.]|jgi:YebC/PmpR family DNA-binding regulatory protein|uniref:Probable transcriptional regulatory protein C8D85_2957 n=2 Tax=Marinomonas TaxID=28253 RepID=A0A4V3DFV4_9GAMM|nr:MULTISPECIES: YebC/PmpR family DNA-binding transcriptional regulator [Marinomonas]MAF14667.1 YebC/PmpR family DNA-binding transcriptional regulator [Marinomonas sp.]MBJ7550134.1 YebC/PmpR family DNA-binding transcriptional regulator [Marinomonas ostreistagni]MCC4275100.1 YebC/PmpR family DNA-binding transcriptional regulator [Marinomonas communis]RUM57564.1 MAG: YebC/PmpR family DNA-binding transcriptional regulator [Marinomonas sp.]TDR06770.1 YebC/PmpR family DNA-binding regulatory protein
MGRAFQNRKESMAKTSDQKAKVYSKYGREIYVCAKSGGIDPAGNLALRSMIERAKKDQVPTHVIEKAIDKAKGGGGEDFDTARYEGFGPGNTMVIVDCLSDNPNRTFGDVRTCFNKVKSKIGTQGSVSHMFDHSAIFVFASEDEDAVMEALLEADVDVSDIESEDGKVSVFTPNTEYGKARQAIIDAFGEVDFDVDEIQFIPQMTTEISGEDVEQFERFLDLLNDLDDVQRVYHNAEF